MDEGRDQAELEQLLRDERARRREAESRLLDLTERAETWRARAEERNARIRVLLEERKQQQSRFRLLRRVGRRAEGPSIADAATADTGDVADLQQPTKPWHPWPALFETLVISLVEAPGQRVALMPFDTRSFSSVSDAELDRADLVVVDPGVVERLDSETSDRFFNWVSTTGRQKLIVWVADGDMARLGPHLGPNDVVVATTREAADRLGVQVVSPSLLPRSESVSPQDTEGSEASRVAAGQRRMGYRHNAPWVRASEILTIAGVDHRSPIPRLAGILVSNRIEDVVRASRAVMDQTHPHTELIVALHGISPSAELEQALESADIPTELVLVPVTRSFGECTNLAIEATSAPLLAKIDDDDHYGPAHFEDSFYAIAYSGADIVGKGAHYTYIADRDMTVLRRPGVEEQVVTGTLNGATLVFKRSVWDQAGFPHRPRHIDTGFLRAARLSGATVYAGSRWEFCYVRRPSGHTWQADEAVFMAGAKRVWDGFHPEMTEVLDGVAP